MMETVLNNVEIGNSPHDSKVGKPNQDVEINITECTNSGVDRSLLTEFQDATDNSSSFGGTISGDENDSTLSEAEAESALCGGSPFGSVCDGFFQMRKRKLTDHWRRFIHPLMWRCKWLELQLKVIKSQALRYDKELADYDQRKKFEYENFTSQGLDVKSRTFPCQVQRNKVMKRRKRKRIENTVELASYMSCHNIFSYYEIRKPVVATAALDDDNGKSGTKKDNTNDDFGFIDELSHMEFGDSNNLSDQILKKIDLLQSQARKLKTRVDKVVIESPRKFSSINRLSSPALTSSRSHPSPTGSGDRNPVRSQHTSSQHLSVSNLRALFRPGNAVSSHGEVIPSPDTIEGSSQHLAGISYENTKDDILIHNQSAKEELKNFQSGLTQQAEEPQIRIENPKTASTALAPANDLPTNPSVQPNVKLSSNSNSKGPKNKRKRGKRKSGAGKWSRRSSGYLNSLSSDYVCIPVMRE